MSEASSRRTLSTILESLGCLSQTIDASLTTHLSKTSASSWKSRITTPHPPFHPQVNGQAEVANRSLLKIIKTKLEVAKEIWPDELPNVL